jgi:hypothetical protein
VSVIGAGNENSGIFLNVVREFLPNLRNLSDATIEKKLGKEKCAEAQRIVWEFIEGSVSGTMTHNERYALLHKSINCLVRWMEMNDIPVTPGTLLSNAHLIPHAVDRAFPMYARAKLLRFMVQSKVA